MLLNQKWGDFVPEAKSRQVSGLSRSVCAETHHRSHSDFVESRRRVEENKASISEPVPPHSLP